VAELARRAAGDLKILARDELELARLEFSKSLRTALADGAAMVLGGVIALIGFALLCMTAVVALAPWVPSLALRMAIMSAVYLVVGGMFASVFMKRLRRDLPPELRRAREEARRTVQAVREEVVRRG
jgi:uncharacterized membrane protein YqjE